MILQVTTAAEAAANRAAVAEFLLGAGALWAVSAFVIIVAHRTARRAFEVAHPEAFARGGCEFCRPPGNALWPRGERCHRHRDLPIAPSWYPWHDGMFFAVVGGPIGLAVLAVVYGARLLGAWAGYRIGQRLRAAAEVETARRAALREVEREMADASAQLEAELRGADPRQSTDQYVAQAVRRLRPGARPPKKT